jgi:hypothetical protein
MVIQLAETLHFGPEGNGFDSLWSYWNFYSPDPFDHSVALDSTQPLTEMSTKGVFCDVKERVQMAGSNLASFLC